MIKRKSSYPVQKNEKMRGGEGFVTIEHLLTPDEMYGKGRLFAKVTIETGCSIGHHVHEGDMESFCVIKGKAEVTDNGETATLSAGDTILTPSGEAHSVKCVSPEPLEMIALILYT